MEIKINEEAVAIAINACADKAIADALSGWEIQQTIGQLISKQVAEGAIAGAIKKAVEQVDTESLTQKLSEELQKATIRATVALLQEGLLSTVCSLRKIGDYSAEDKATRLRLKAELFA